MLDPLTNTLQHMPDLYKIPADELEILVSQTVREPGFADFLAKLEDMWRVRGLIGH
jgi:hypothetical protein